MHAKQFPIRTISYGVDSVGFKHTNITQEENELVTIDLEANNCSNALVTKQPSLDLDENDTQRKSLPHQNEVTTDWRHININNNLVVTKVNKIDSKADDYTSKVQTSYQYFE